MRAQITGMSKIPSIVLFLISLCQIMNAGDGLPQENVSFQETLMAKVEPGAGDFAFSPDGRAVAYRQDISGKQAIVWGGKMGEPFDRISDITVSPDGKTVAYIGVKGDRWHGVVGEIKGEGYDHVWKPVFSKNGKGSYYKAFLGDKKRIVFNSRPGELFDDTGDVALSADGTTCVYSGTLFDPQTYMPVRYVMVNEKKSGPLYDVIGPVMNADGSQMAYIVRANMMDGTSAGSTIVLNDKKIEPVGDPLRLKFTPDGKQLAYLIRQGGAYSIVVGDKVFEAPGFNEGHEFAVSPDSSTVAYGAQTNPYEDKAESGWRIVVGGKKGPVFDMVGEPVFSPDGTLVAYPAEKGGNSFVMVGDQKGEEFNHIKNLTFSPAGNHVAYYARSGDNDLLVLDGKKGPAFLTLNDPFVWSPDGRAVAYKSQESGKYFIMAGDKRSEPLQSVWPPVFSSDGKKVAFGAEKDVTDPKTYQTTYELWWKVMDVP